MHTTVRRQAVRVRIEDGSASSSTRAEVLATEEPLELRLNGEPFTTTMRTPGHDLELALGFLVGEGVIAAGEDVLKAQHCPAGKDEATRYNAVEIQLAPHVPPPARARHRHVTSACGVCGTASVDEVLAKRAPIAATGVRAAEPARFDPAVLAGLPAAMRSAQRVFDRTGGLHAAALFSAGGELLCVREDVGRHNAVDKVVGWAFVAGLLPLAAHVLQVSGRASFELVQKAWLAGLPVLAAVSAPSSLAADLAEQSGLTLIGFSRGDRFTVYSGSARLA